MADSRERHRRTFSATDWPAEAGHPDAAEVTAGATAGHQADMNRAPSHFTANDDGTAHEYAHLAPGHAGHSQRNARTGTATDPLAAGVPGAFACPYGCRSNLNR